MFDRKLNIILLIFCACLAICDGDLSAHDNPGDPRATKLLPSACRNGSSAPEIRLPFVDIIVNYEFPIFVLREPEEDILLLLHGPEIFRLHVAAGERRLLPLGKLAGRVGDSKALGAELVSWRQFLLLAIVLEDSLEVYQLPKELLLSEDPASLRVYDPLQEFSLPGGFLQLHLVKASADQVLLLVASNLTNTQSKVRTFEWLETYFNPLEEMTLPAIRVLEVVGRQPIYFIFGRSLKGSQSKLVLTVYELDRSSLRLQIRQALTVQGPNVQAVRFHNRNCLLACTSATSDPCIFFRMLDGQFVVYRKHTRRDLHFRRVAATKRGQLLIGARSNGEVLVFGSTRLDCFSGFVVAGREEELVEPNSILTHRNARNETFLLLAYRKSSSAVIRTLQLVGVEEVSSNQVGATPDEDLSVVQLHRHEFEATINGLRGLLLRRRSSLEKLRHLVTSLKQKSGIQLEKPLHLLPGGRIDRLQLVGRHLRTPTKLKQRLEELRHRFLGNHPRRNPRSFGTGNDDDELLKIKRLRVGNLIYQGQLLPSYTLDSNSPPLLTIRQGNVLTKSLQTNELLTPKDNENKTLEEIQSPNHQECVVRHLHVSKINGVSWDSFLDSLFLRSRDTRLQGRLVLQSRTRVSNLQTRLLNGLVVDQLFNLRRAQVISSNIFMSAFFAPRLEAKSVNNLDFAKDIVFRGDNDTWIKTPVRIDQMSVSGEFQVANQKPQARQSVNDVLQQYYTGRITIQGSLTVRNVLKDTQNAAIMLGNQSLSKSDLNSQYLLQNKPQNITLLAFGNAKVTVPSLTTDYIKGHPLEEHLLSGGQDIASHSQNHTLHLIFMNASVQGDIICRDYSSRLAEIAKDAVPLGQETNITGFKRFKAPLIVQDLETKQINVVPVSELVLKNNPNQNFTGFKVYDSLVITDDLEVQKDLNVNRLNGLPLEQLLGHDLSLQRLELVDTPYLEKLHFRRLNGLPFDELLSKISETEEDQRLLLHKQLLLEGNVRFEKPLQVKDINGIPWEDYLKRLVRSDVNSELKGRKTFLSDVLLTDNLKTPLINNFDLSSLLDNTLLRTTPQEIGGSYSFGSLRVSNLDVKRVNNVSHEEFLDLRKDQVLKGDLYLKELSIKGGLKCPEMSNQPDLSNLPERLENVRQLPWRNLFVTGNALWPESNNQDLEQLEYLRKHAVRKDQNQTITGHVLLRKPSIKVLQAQGNLLQDLDLKSLKEDALLRRSEDNKPQIITAPVEFLGPLKALTLKLNNDSYFGQLNGIDIPRLNASLYRLSSNQSIAADLNFLKTPKFGKLELKDPQVNGIKIQDIYQQNRGLTWPRITLKNLTVKGDLKLGSVNTMSMEYFLDNRITLRGPALEVFGNLNFENLQLGERPLLRSINNIQLENLVLRNSNKVQTISGVKTFHGGLEWNGPGHVMNLNGKDLSESYRGSIFKDKDYNIDSLVLEKALFPGGTNQKARVMEPLKEDRSPLEELKEVLALKNQTTSHDLLYLDHDLQPLEVIWMKTPLKGSPHLILPLPKDTNPCQRRMLQAQLLSSQQKVLLANVSVSHRLLRIKSGDIRVKVQNHCPVRRLRSRISFSCRNESHILGMRQPVEVMDLLNLKNLDPDVSLLLLGTEKEVRVLRLNRGSCRIEDWQSVTPADGRLMKIVSLQDEDLLITSGVKSHRSVLAIHARSPLEQQFHQLQLIHGGYDLAEIMAEQLLASCLGCRHIAIYRRNSSRVFEPLQQLSFQERIQQLTPFWINDVQYLLVITQPGAEHFYLFTFGPVGGWQQKTFGYKKQHQWAWPLITAGEKLVGQDVAIMLLCGQNEQECSLVKAILR
ncbi:hypothetical protein KR026_007032 [Drosophila bipectinata]|nr:hypothetical protein KR026_007032 [Drosophila bipectinata]